MSLNFNNNIFWGKGTSTPNNNNPPATYTTATGSIGANLNATGGSGGGGGNWQVGNIGMAGVVGSTGAYIGTIKCDRCGYKETPYEDKYCKLCNEEL